MAELDQVGISLGSEESFDLQPLSLATARETDGKEVGNALRGTDGTVLRIDPGAEVELAFAMRPVPEGMVRSRQPPAPDRDRGTRTVTHRGRYAHRRTGAIPRNRDSAVGSYSAGRSTNTGCAASVMSLVATLPSTVR